MAKPAPARPVWNVLALVLLGAVAAVCVALGRWQLDRASMRRDVQHSITEGRARAPVTLAADTPRAELRDWRPAQAQGRWRHDLTVLLENRNHNGRPGYWVVTPLVFTGVGKPAAVLVLRGWVVRRFDAARPAIPAPQDLQIIHGQLLAQVPRMYELPPLWGNATDASSLDYAAGMPVVTNLTLAAAARGMGLDFLPVVLQQLDTGAGSADDLVRDWDGPSVDADKNVGYAIQWFGFATIALIAALVMICRSWRKRAARGMFK